MKKLNKKIKFSKYINLFSKNKLFFICLLDNHNNYLDLSRELSLNNFQTKFIQNSFLKKLPYFKNIKSFLNGQLFCILKDKLNVSDYLFLRNTLFLKGNILLFYLDNKFYTDEKLYFLNDFFKSKTSNLSYLYYTYFLLKLGFILKLEIFLKSVK